MNNKIKSSLFTLLILMTGKTVYAYDIKVDNADGVTIYYNYINDGTELEVTSPVDKLDYYSNHYSGVVKIPEEVTFMDKTRKVTSIGHFAFFGCRNLVSVIIPQSVTSIDGMAFYDCSGLTSITIPNSVTSIGDSAFKGCEGLTSVAISNNMTSIGDYAFWGCTSLASVNIPNSVTSIGDFGFAECTSLASVNIPNSVTSIGWYAFALCRGLTSVTIPNSVTSIRGMAFYGVNLSVVISKIEDPFRIEGKDSKDLIFETYTFNNATLYVPKGTISKYKATEGWKDFAHVEEETSSGISGVSAQSLSIQILGSTIIVQGCDEGRQVVVYGLDGAQAGASISHNGQAVIGTSVQPGSVVIVKIGDKSVKVLMK